MSNLFDNLSPDEQKLLDAYENTINSGELTRTDDEKIFDKLSLLAKARLAINSSRRGFKIDADYIGEQIESLKKIPPNYSEEGKLSATARMISNFYEAKKSANYNITSDGMLTSENRRTTNFTAAGKDFSNFLLTNDNNGSLDIINRLDDGWIYRKPKNFPQGPIDHRYALNVKQNKELLHKLDEFTAKHKMHYKTSRALNWHDRTDAVVIYCSAPQTAEEIAELKKIAAPYIRRDRPSRTNDLDGEIIADGIATAKETTPRQCAELYHKLKAVNPTIANTFRKTVDEQIQKNPHNPISLGQFQNYTNLLDTFTAERNKAPLQNDRQQTQSATDKSLSHLRGQDYVFAMLDQLYAQNKAKLAQQKDSSVKHNGPSARQKAQEHMGGRTNDMRNNRNQQRMPVEKNNWKTKLKKAAAASLRLTKKLIKEVILAPYLLAKEIYNLPDRLKPLPPKPNPKYDWRNNPQRMAQVSLRYNRMFNRQKTAPLQRKDLALFIQSMRNGNNANLQQQQSAPPHYQTTQRQLPLHIIKLLDNKQR